MISSPESHHLLPLETFRDQFNQGLEIELDRLVNEARPVDPLFAELLETMSSYIRRSGKRLRPYLTYLAYVGSGGTQVEEIIRLGISQELYHNAWLIHDDLIDRDLRRHGGLNIAGTYRAKFASTNTPGGRHVADGMALLAGDIAITAATRLILESNFELDRRLAAMHIQQQHNLRILSGETLDVLMPTRPLAEISINRLQSIYALKTAAYSFVAPLQIGAVLAGASKDRLTHIATFAEPLGIAFQITDDLLGMFGNEQEIGKSVLSDLREGKRTVLILIAIKSAKNADRQRLEQLLGNPKAGYRHLAEARQILTNTGAKSQTEALAQTQVNTAIKALPAAGFTTATHEALENLARFMIRRRS